MSEELRPRIVGTETEFGLSLKLNPKSAILSAEMLRKAKPLGLVMISGFLSNGGRFYVDAGQQLEYATPECLGFTDAVHAEIAGEHIVYETLENLKAQGKAKEFHLYRRVIDSTIHTWGYHENYLMNRADFMTPTMRALMLSHLASRNIFVGAGRLQQTAEGYRVVPAQKAQDLEVNFSNSTVSQKPLLNTRDQPHCDERYYARLHITSGDVNVSPWASWMQLGTTSLVLRLIETEFADVDSVALNNAVEVSGSVANDYTLRNVYDMYSGGRLRALDVQERLIEQCEQMAECFDLPKEEREVLNEWRRAHTDLQESTDRLTDRVGWIARTAVLEGFADRHGLKSLDDPKIGKVDQTWDMIHPQAGRGIRFARQCMTFTGFDMLKVGVLTKSPPEGTRAKTRGEAIRNTPRKLRSETRLDWSHVRNSKVDLDPLMPYAL